MRTLALAAIIALTLQAAAFADQVAVTDQLANPRNVASGKILGAQNYAVDTYGINLVLNDGVKPRDIYAVRRGNKTVGEAMVVYVGTEFSLLTMKSGACKRGDEVVYLRHADMPQEPVKLVPHEPVIVRERDTMSSRQIPGGSFGSSASFSSSTSFNSTSSYNSTTSYNSSTGFGSTQGFAGPGFGSPSFGGGPSFGSGASFGPAQSFQGPSFGMPSFSH